MKRFSILIFSFYVAILSGEILEIHEMKQLLPYIEEGAFVVFDIDNTLIEPVQELGNDQWFRYRKKTYISSGCSKEEALEKTLREWSAIQNVTEVQLAEEGIDQIIEHLQIQNIPMIGLTTRGLGVSTLTVQQLKSVNIDLLTTAPTKEEFYFKNGRGVLFRGGILFTAATHKGEALKRFLEEAEFLPSKVIFVNDKYSHIVPVEEVCEELGIPFVGLRYGFLDQKVRNFREQVAKVQYYFFGHILSDEAAERILNER